MRKKDDLMQFGGEFMWGAIIGDLAGSIYEFEQTKKIKQVTVD